MGISRFKIGSLKIVLVGKYRFSKKEKQDQLSSFTTWKDWRIGFWFRKSRIVGVKNIKDPAKWKNGLVNDYMLGIDLLIFHGWINWNMNGALIDMGKREERKRKMEEDKMIYEVVASLVMANGNVSKDMPESDLIIEIYKSTSARYGKKKANYYMNVDEDFLSDCVTEINERLKQHV